MREIIFAKTIVDLRKQKGVTQEQLANAINLSPQAVSKWETGTSLPDPQILPLISEYFGVSIDYLFYGKNFVYRDLYHKIFEKVAFHAQMSKESYEEALRIFALSHHGISHGNIRGRNDELTEVPKHISNENGLSLLSGRGYGAIVTRGFFEYVDRETANFAGGLFSVLSENARLLVCMAILSMSDISFGELKERLGMDEKPLRKALDELIASKLVFEKKSKHKSLGLTYEINDMYHTCLCILLATAEMQHFSQKGISCCMGYGDYPIKL